jgi:hypothetical protein
MGSYIKHEDFIRLLNKNLQYDKTLKASDAHCSQILECYEHETENFDLYYSKSCEDIADIMGQLEP